MFEENLTENIKTQGLSENSDLRSQNSDLTPIKPKSTENALSFSLKENADMFRNFFEDLAINVTKNIRPASSRFRKNETEFYLILIFSQVIQIHSLMDWVQAWNYNTNRNNM